MLKADLGLHFSIENIDISSEVELIDSQLENLDQVHNVLWDLMDSEEDANDFIDEFVNEPAHELDEK